MLTTRYYVTISIIEGQQQVLEEIYAPVLTLPCNLSYTSLEM